MLLVKGGRQDRSAVLQPDRGWGSAAQHCSARPHFAQEAANKAHSTWRRRRGPARQAGITATLAHYTGGA